MKRYIHLLWFVLLTACSAKHQPLRLEPNRVLFHSSEVGQVSTTPTDSIKWIRPIAFSRGTLKIRYADGHDTRVAKNTFWGYSDRRGRVYRRYRKTYLEVVHMGDVVKYEEHTTTTHSVNGQAVGMPVTNTYYSKNLDSRIFSSPKKALRDTGAAYQ